MRSLEAAVSAKRALVLKEGKCAAKLAKQLRATECTAARHRVHLADARASLATCVELGQTLAAKLRKAQDLNKSTEAARATELAQFLAYVDAQVSDIHTRELADREQATMLAREAARKRLEGQSAIAQLQHKLQGLQARMATLARRRSALEGRAHDPGEAVLSDDDTESLSDVGVEVWADSDCSDSSPTRPVAASSASDVTDLRTRAELESRRKQALIRRRVTVRHEQAAARRKISQGRALLRQAAADRSVLDKRRRVLEARLLLMSNGWRGKRTPTWPQHEASIVRDDKGSKQPRGPTRDGGGFRGNSTDQPATSFKLASRLQNLSSPVAEKGEDATPHPNPAPVSTTGGSPTRMRVCRRRTPHKPGQVPNEAGAARGASITRTSSSHPAAPRDMGRKRGRGSRGQGGGRGNGTRKLQGNRSKNGHSALAGDSNMPVDTRFSLLPPA